MSMYLVRRRASDDAARHSKGARIAVAIFATAALCLGPSVAAYADDSVEEPDATEVATMQAAVEEPVVEEPVMEQQSFVEDSGGGNEGVQEESLESEGAGEGAGATEPPPVETQDELLQGQNKKSDDKRDSDNKKKDDKKKDDKKKDDKKKDKKDKDKNKWRDKGDCEVTPRSVPEVLSMADIADAGAGEAEAESLEALGAEELSASDFSADHSQQSDRRDKGERGDRGQGDHKYKEKCHKPPKPKPAPKISVDPGPCIPYGSEGEFESVTEITGSNLKPGEKYKVTVSHGESTVSSQWVTAGKRGTASVSVGVSWAGSYVATISSHGPKGQSASQEFWIDECDPVVPTPGLDVKVLTCVAGDPANALQAVFTASGLLPGEEALLEVSGPGGFAWSGSLTGSEAGTAEVTVVLGANGSYTAWLSVEGVVYAPAVAMSYDGPSQQHRSESETVTLEFTAAKDCPTTKTVVQTKAVTPVLAETGSAGGQGLLWAGAVAIIIAAGLMLEPVIAKRIRRARR